jgi:hypothetical protein
MDDMRVVKCSPCCAASRGMYTEFVETGSLAAYARALGELLKPYFSVSWTALIQAPVPVPAPGSTSIASNQLPGFAAC